MFIEDKEETGINFALLHLLDALDSVDYAVNSLIDLNVTSEETKQSIELLDVESIKRLRESVKVDHSNLRRRKNRGRSNE